MKKVLSVSTNEDGTIKGILFEGNKKTTPLSVVVRMLEDGKEVDFTNSGLEVVALKSGKKYIRSIANATKDDNLGTMADAVAVEEDAMVAVWEEIKKDPTLMDRFKQFMGKFL